MARAHFKRADNTPHKNIKCFYILRQPKDRKAKSPKDSDLIEPEVGFHRSNAYSDIVQYVQCIVRLHKRGTLPLHFKAGNIRFNTVFGIGKNLFTKLLYCHFQILPRGKSQYKEISTPLWIPETLRITSTIFEMVASCSMHISPINVWLRTS